MFLYSVIQIQILIVVYGFCFPFQLTPLLPAKYGLLASDILDGVFLLSSATTLAAKLLHRAALPARIYFLFLAAVGLVSILASWRLFPRGGGAGKSSTKTAARKTEDEDEDDDENGDDNGDDNGNYNGDGDDGDGSESK